MFSGALLSLPVSRAGFNDILGQVSLLSYLTLNYFTLHAHKYVAKLQS